MLKYLMNLPGRIFDAVLKRIRPLPRDMEGCENCDVTDCTTSRWTTCPARLEALESAERRDWAAAAVRVKRSDIVKMKVPIWSGDDGDDDDPDSVA